MSRDLGHVLDAILAGVVVLDAHGAVERLNAAACRMLDLSAEATRDASLARLLGAAHPLVRLADSVLAGGASASRGDVALEPRGAGRLLVDAAASPLFSEAGELDGAVVVLRDRTLQRRLERLETERERRDAFGGIAAGLAHEVKNPLGGIRGAAELLGQRAGDVRTRETAELIVREATRIAALVDDFMVLARDEKLELRAVNVHEVLDRVLDLLALDPVAGRAHVERSFDPSIPLFLADPDRLAQVFLNLARNALQALPETGGRLCIETRADLAHRLAVGPGPPLPSVAIRFADDGPGMSADVLRRATTPFFTTRAAGTGLGLALSEYWVSRHGGSLQLESAPGAGTTVRVHLPLRRIS